MKSLFIVLLLSGAVHARAAAKAVADLRSPTQKILKAHVEFKPTPDGFRMIADVSGLGPNAKHGFHVHEFGKCEGPDFKSAGEHYNPKEMVHGKPTDSSSHLGDLGNLISDKNGNAHLELNLSQREKGDLEKLIGKSIIIHKEADDLKTQPSGDSGERIACGVIKAL